VRDVPGLSMVVLAAWLVGGAEAPPARAEAPPAQMVRSPHAQGLALQSGLRAGLQPGARLTRSELLDRAGARVHAYLTELPRLVATESMAQHVVQSRSPAPDGGERRWIAEIAWVRLNDEHEAIAVRDVLEVDGHPVSQGRARLVELLHGARRGTWSEARELLAEGARHNLVPGSRNFNLPTVALFFLHPERRSRFAWTARFPRDTPASSAGPFEVEFRERSRPTVIHGANGEQIYGRGRIWVAGDGVVMRTELQLEIGPVKYTLATEFKRDDAISMVVPYQLTERYDAPDGAVVSTARYSNYRRFQSSARLVGH
jgi:hypothetical protein